jgi:hypothetical protein
MSDIPPTAVTVNVEYNNRLKKYNLRTSGPFVPKTYLGPKDRDEMITLITSIKEYHSVHYDGQEGRVKLPFWIHFCNKYDTQGNFTDNSHYWFSSVVQFTGALELDQLPHHDVV